MLSSETCRARYFKEPQSREPIRFTVHFLNIFGTTNSTRRIPSPTLSLLCGGINLAARSVAHCGRTSSLGSSIIREHGAGQPGPNLYPSHHPRTHLPPEGAAWGFHLRQTDPR